MLGIFKSKPILSSEDIEFQVATFEWLLKNFGGKDFYEDINLVLPTKEYFPSVVENETEVAHETFDAVKKHAGLEEWPCSLQVQESDIDIKVAPTIVMQDVPKTPLGTFEVKAKDDIVITYNPELVKDPARLISTYAHELAHYLTATSVEAPPGGWDNWEFATDITATYLGFGIFMANSAFSFGQYADNESQGWQYSRNGYLTENEHIFALAIFLNLKDIPVEKAVPYLKKSLVKTLRKAVKQVADSDYIGELKAI